MLYERRHELVLAFLLKRTRNPEVAMDLMAETFAAALVALADRPPAIDGSAAPWLLTIARNAMVDSYRRGRVRVRPVSASPSSPSRSATATSSGSCRLPPRPTC